VSVLVSTLDPFPHKSLLHTQEENEARVGIEPTHTAFAEPRLTTWLPRLFDRERLTYSIARKHAKQKFPGENRLGSVLI
jgi:hypothetical protein